MNEIPKISVILTSFNHAKYIAEAIESVLNQTFTDFELIIWDDCSSDNTWDLINQYSDPRIKAFRNEVNKGPVEGVNKAISEVATGEYIAIHHSDDAWEPDKLEKQVAFLDSHAEVGAIFSNALAVGEDSTPLADQHHYYSSIFDQPNRTRYEWLHHFFSRGNALCHPSVLIRKVCYQECGLYRRSLAQVPDLDMWMRLCLKYEIHVLPEKLVRFRVRENEANASGSRPETRIRGLYELYKLLTNYRKIKSIDELVKVFPSVEKYDRNDETDLDFALAMVALEGKPFCFTQLFGQDLMFEAISDPTRAANIKRLYNFDYSDFIALTAKHDVFSREEVSTLLRNATERDLDIEALTNTLDEIYQSPIGKLIEPMRWYDRRRRLALKLIKSLPALISVSGGLMPLIRTIIRVWRYEKIQGVKRFLRWQLAEISNIPGKSPLPVPGIAQEPVGKHNRVQPVILFVSHEASRTGAPIFLLNLIRELKNRLDISCHILLRSGGELEEQFRQLGPTEILPSKNNLPAEVLQRLKKGNIKLVYSNTISNGLIQKRLSRLGCPILCHVHELAHSINNYYESDNLDYILNSTDLYLAAARETVDFLISQKGLPKEKVVLAHPFVDTDNIRKLSQTTPPLLDFPKGTIVIGACGTTGWRKGTDLFVQFAKIVQTHTKLHIAFVWVGGSTTPDEISGLRYDVDKLGLSKQLIFTGQVESPLKYFSQFDIFVLPSREDPFPLVMLEAASMGLPVVCFDKAGGATELVGDDAGIVVPYLDVRAMADAVCKLVNDENLRKSLGEQARKKVVQRYDSSVGIELIISSIEKQFALGMRRKK